MDVRYIACMARMPSFLPNIRPVYNVSVNERSEMQPMTQKVAIFGAGAQGRVTLDILRACNNVAVVGFIDSNPDLKSQKINDLSVFGSADAIREAFGTDSSVIIALGANKIRMNVANALKTEGWQLFSAIHPSAVISQSARIGQNVAIMPHALVHSNAVVHDHAIINSSTVIEHDSIVGAGASVSPGTQVGGRVTIGESAFIGTGAIILPRVTIGEQAVIAAGALVTKDVPDRTLVAGSPAKHVQDIDDDFDWKRLL